MPEETEPQVQQPEETPSQEGGPSPQPTQQQQGTQDRRPSPDAWAAQQRIENRRLSDRLQQNETRLQNVLNALKAVAGGEQKPPEEDAINPHDVVTEPQEYARWDAEERRRQRDRLRTEVRGEVLTEAQQTLRQEAVLQARTELTAQAEADFLARYPQFSDGKGEWRDDLRTTVMAEASRKFQRGEGSGRNGALTTKDIEKIVRAEAWEEWQTAAVRQNESEVISVLKGVEGGPVRGNVTVPNNPNEMSEDQIIDTIYRLSPAQANALLDQLSSAKKDALLLNPKMYRR